VAQPPKEGRSSVAGGRGEERGLGLAAESRVRRW
jgi:hypothetical protein